MAQNDAAVVLGTTGIIAIAPVGTADPATLSSAYPTPPTPWTVIGHTSLDNLPSWTEDGGDQSTIGTWQAPSLRQVQTKAATQSITFNSDQIDPTSLGLYYGQSSAVTTVGRFDVYGTGSVEHALLLLIADGTNVVGFTARRASFSRSDDIGLATDAFTELPIKASFLQYTSGGTTFPLFSWLSSSFVVGS